MVYPPDSKKCRSKNRPITRTPKRYPSPKNQKVTIIYWMLYKHIYIYIYIYIYLYIYIYALYIENENKTKNNQVAFFTG